MRRFAVTLCLLAAACAAPPPTETPRPAPPAGPAGQPVPSPGDSGARSPANPAGPVRPPGAPQALDVQVPDDALYACVVGTGTGRVQSSIEFSPRVLDLCRRHPEMGPCQYERNVCRQRGGRVFAHGGAEITLQTEAEYDRKVLRRQFRSN